MFWILLAAVLFLAYANGANDNFKGVATLFGSGTTDYRKALGWATGTTLAGSLVSLILAGKLIQAFSGKGLVADTLTQDPSFSAAVALGAAMTVLLATLVDLPISTTHALTGALVGAGLAADGAVEWGRLGKVFLLPLIASPALSIVLTAPFYAGLRTFSLQGQMLLNSFHILSGGLVSFARGLNDTPKIVALLAIGPSLPMSVNLLLVGLVMAAGGVLNGRQVAHTMSHRITGMSDVQGFSANAVTALLVLAASRFGLPVSTTHVSCGSLFGIGLINGEAKWANIASILTAWITTLPLGALLGAAAYGWVSP